MYRSIQRIPQGDQAISERCCQWYIPQINLERVGAPAEGEFDLYLGVPVTCSATHAPTRMD